MHPGSQGLTAFPVLFQRRTASELLTAPLGSYRQIWKKFKSRPEATVTLLGRDRSWAGRDLNFFQIWR